MRLLSFVLASALFAACAAPGEDLDLSVDADASAPSTPSDSDPSTRTADGHSAASLIQFRDAAAAAPVWRTVRRVPPSTVAAVIHGGDDVTTGTLIEAVLPEAPRADELVPYEGAPTLHHLEVHLTVLDEHGQRQTARVPVLSSGAEGLALGEEAAQSIIDLAPLGTDVLLVSSEGRASLVAMEAEDASLVGYYSSLDDVVSQHTLGSLRTAIGNALHA